MARTTVPTLSRDDAGLSRYLDEVHKFPILEKEEEFEYARAWLEHGDKEAAQKLVTSHLRLAAKMALGYRGYGLAVEDLISEANLGLMRAVRSFDPDKGFRLATYAMWWIRASVQEYILRSWSLVKLGTSAARKSLFFNLKRAKHAIQAYEDGEMTSEHVRQIADRLNVAEEDVIDMNRRLAGIGDISLNTSIGHEDEGEEWQDWLTDGEADHVVEITRFEEASLRHDMLETAMEGLSDRERRIIAERRLAENPLTLEQLAKEFGVSRERIRQIENRAFEKVQAKVMEIAEERRLIPRRHGGAEAAPAA